MGPVFAFLAACAFAQGTVLQQKGTLDTTSGSGDSHWLIQILHKPVWLAGCTSSLTATYTRMVRE